MLTKHKEMLRSGGVGVVATVVDLVLLVTLTEVVGLSPMAANLPALSGGLLVQFFGNKFFAFGDHSRDYARQGAQFALVEAGAFSLNALLFHVALSLTLLPYAAVRVVCSAVVYLGYSFPLWRWIFKPRPRVERLPS
jgi:putative flippase GtrA